MRTAETARLELIDVNIEAGLGGVAVEKGLIDVGRFGRVSPFVLVWRRVSHDSWIELDSMRCRRKAQCRGENCETRAQLANSSSHVVLPCLGRVRAPMVRLIGRT